MDMVIVNTSMNFFLSSKILALNIWESKEEMLLPQFHKFAFCFLKTYKSNQPIMYQNKHSIKLESLISDCEAGSTF